MYQTGKYYLWPKQKVAQERQQLNNDSNVNTKYWCNEIVTFILGWWKEERYGGAGDKQG